ncbi:MAG: thioredoxin-disulfide reductase [Spirochaetia bacterium]
MQEIIDVAIIGGGSAGLAAAQYAARANLKTTVFEKLGAGGQCLLIDNLENYPGILSINGFEFSQQMQKQAQDFGAQFTITEITAIEQDADKIFHLKTNKQTYLSRTLIAATGAKHKMLMIPGEEELRGRGVSYCATCDGPFFRNKHILVVGGGDAACDEATFLSKLTDKITMIHRRDTFRAQKAVADRVLKNPQIDVRWNTQLTEISGSKKVEKVTLYNNQEDKSIELEVDAVFIFIGSDPQSQLFQFAKCDAEGHLITNEKMETNISGLFAVGDVRTTPFRQIITACADGALAANQASHYLDTL